MFFDECHDHNLELETHAPRRGQGGGRQRPGTGDRNRDGRRYDGRGGRHDNRHRWGRRPWGRGPVVLPIPLPYPTYPSYPPVYQQPVYQQPANCPPGYICVPGYPPYPATY